MKFTPTWYKQDVADIPSFQELEDITGSAYDKQGIYIGPKEKPDMQLVMDRRTNRQYWAPKEYDEDAIKYSTARMEQNFNSQEWWGMVRDPHLTVGQKVSTAYIEGLKQFGKFVAKAPTEIVAGVTGITDAFGVDAGAFAKAAFINNPTNLPIYLASSVARKGIKATAQDYLQLLKDIKTPSGKMGETASLYRASAQNWQNTLNKYLPDVDDNIKAHSTMVVIGSMAGQIGGSLLLAAATNGVGGLPAVASVFGSQQFYNIREEYLEKGFSLESANIYAGIAAVFEGGLEAVGFTKWLKYATLKPSLRNHLIAGFMEASQEMSQTTAEELITNLSGVREETLTEILAQIAISGVAGFLPGAGISAMSGGLGIRQEKAAYELDNALKNTAIVPQNKQQANVPPKEGEVIKGTTPKQELELAKANKGSNQLYEVVRNIANSYGVSDDKTIDSLYYFARNQAVQGKLGEELLSGLGKQLIAYKNTLALPDKTSDKENKRAAADLTFHLSKEAAEKFHNDNVKAMKERGATDQQAEVLAEQQDKIYKNLSEQFGVDLQEVKEVKVTAIPSREQAAQVQEAEQADSYEGEIPFQDRQSEADSEIKALQKQIDELDKLANKKPKSTLLSTLRKTGVDYKNSRLDPQVLKDMRIKNVPVSKGGLGGESAEYLIRHGFIRAAQQLDIVTYEDAREQDAQADDMLSRAVAGEEVYRADDQEMISQAEQAAGYKEQLQAELDGKLAEKGKRGYIKIGEILNEIVLGKTADVTTLQHELMHHWKDVIETMAAKGNKKAQALKAQMDKIIAENKDYVRQDINKEEEVLSEAFEAWLYSGVVAEDPKQQALFEAIKRYFQDVYDSIKAITGIRINPEIDLFFRQMTGEMPIQMQQDMAAQEETQGKYNFKVTKGEKAGLNQQQREHVASEIINNMEGSLFSRFKVKDVKGEWPAGGNPRRAKQWWVDEQGKKTTKPNVIAGSKYHSNPKEVIKINIPGSKAVLTVHKDALAVRALFKDLGISITPKKEYANDRMYQAAAMYMSPHKKFAKFFEVAKTNDHKSYFPFKSKNGIEIHIPSDTLIHDEKHPKMNVEKWEDLMESIDNITYAARETLKNRSKYGGVPVLLSIDGKKGKYGVVLEIIPSNGRVILTTGFTGTDKGINAWIKNKKSAETLPPIIFDLQHTTSKEVAGSFNGHSSQYSIDNIVNFFKTQKGTMFQDGIKYDKNGKADINSPEFKKWFGNSKVVDENGQPLIVYHGTDANFTAFDMSKGRANMDIQGAFFSPWELDAKGYGQNVGAYYLSIQNPADEATGYAALRRFQGQNEAGKKAKEYLQSLGYDGVINNNEEYIVFEPTQIKSVYNKGTFDKKNPNIYYQPGYHGSARKFAYFDLQHIGTGEGAQAHGWGLYIAASQDVAELYRAKLIEREASLAGIDANSFFYNNQHYFMKGDGFYVSNNAANKETEGAKNLTREEYRDVYLAAVEEDRAARERDEQKGQVYEVEIPENDVLLDEQKRFAEQPKKVQEAINKLREKYPDIRTGHKGLWIYKDIVREGPYATEKENQKWASQTLLKYGIEGITYDGRQDGRCYVIFNDKAARIQKTFYQTVKAQQTGSKAADDKPSKEQIANDLQTIRNNGVEKYKAKNKIIENIGDFGKDIILSVRQRAGAIDPKIKAFFDKLDFFQPNLERKFASKAHGFVKKFQKLTEAEKNEFDYYIYNQCHEELNAFLKEKGMEQEYQEVRQLLNFIYAISNKAGIDMGFIEEYFPTSMIDYAGFLDHMKGTDKWSYIAKALREADPEGVWSDKEKAEAINKLLRGYSLDPVRGPKNAKERKILYKSPELMRFYEHSDVALVKYLQGMSQAIAINKAFGKGGGFDTDATIGAIVLELIENGTITNKEEAEIRRLLKSRLSYGATPELFALIKNVGYLQTMNNITSAITQLGDLYAPFYKYSFGTAIKSIFGKSEITKTDLGLDRIWEEFSDNSKSGIAVEKLFKAIGLEAMDSFGKNVAINVSWLNLKEQAAKADMGLMARLSYTFGKDAQRVLADIKAGNITDDVKILIWADLADTQPIGRSGVPTGYLDNPRMRLFYQLKTFTLNQISLFYADSLVNIQKGIKYKNKEQFLKGVQNGFKLLLLLTAGNAAADVLKNLIMGRDIDISDTVISNLLWNVGVSKYTFYRGKRDGYARALLSSYLTPPQLSIGDDIYMDVRKMAAGKCQGKDSQMWTYLPVIGRPYYWWFGGGRTAEKEKAKKAKKKKK